MPTYIEEQTAALKAVADFRAQYPLLTEHWSIEHYWTLTGFEDYFNKWYRALLAGAKGLYFDANVPREAVVSGLTELGKKFWTQSVPDEVGLQWHDPKRVVIFGELYPLFKEKRAAPENPILPLDFSTYDITGSLEDIVVLHIGDAVEKEDPTFDNINYDTLDESWMDVDIPGTIAVDGDLTVGTVLQATIFDPNGILDTVPIAFRWQTKADAGEWTTAQETTLPLGLSTDTFALLSEYEGQRVRIRATYRDNVAPAQEATRLLKGSIELGI